MNDRFDAYQNWLGIPPHEQPPDLYRLLGLARLESDTQLVTAAAERQVAKVKEKATREHLALAQKLVKQIAKARSTLTDPRLRAHYNHQLQQMAPVQPASLHGGLDLTNRVVGVRGTQRSGRKQVSIYYRFPLTLGLFVCVIGAGIVLAMRLPDVVNRRNDDSLIDGGGGIGLTGIMGTAATSDQDTEAPADGTSMPPRKAASEIAERPVGEMPPSSVVVVPAEQAGEDDVAVKPNEPLAPLPETTGIDPLRDDFDPDDFADEAFSADGDEVAEDPLMENERGVDGTPSDKSTGGRQNVDRESGQSTDQQEDSRKRMLTFEEEQARHGQRSPRKQAPDDGER